MWRSCFSRCMTMAVMHGKSSSSGVGSALICPTLYPPTWVSTWRFSTANSGDDDKGSSTKAALAANVNGGNGNEISLAEVKKLMRLVNVESLKTKLSEEGKDVIGYKELIDVCESMGVSRSVDEARAFASVLDDAGVVLLFRDKVYLHPDKVVDLVMRSVPLALTPEEDPTREELKRLQESKDEIDRQAHKQVRAMLWSGLMVSVMQVSLFFRLTYWEFSWDVMEPIAFFTTASGIVTGYAYFMFTSKDPSYQDFMKTMFVSRQRKLFKKYKFDVHRFNELNDKCKTRRNETLLLEDA